MEHRALVSETSFPGAKLPKVLCKKAKLAFDHAVASNDYRGTCASSEAKVTFELSERTGYPIFPHLLLIVSARVLEQLFSVVAYKSPTKKVTKFANDRRLTGGNGIRMTLRE